VAGGTTTHYVHGLGGKLYGEYDNAGVLIREYVWLNGEPLAQIDAGSPEVLTYLHTDHLQTPRYGTNAAGSTVWTWDSGAFGKEAPTGTATVNLRFPGQYYDSETTLHYNWNRYYNPVTGRYVSSDPIGLAGGLNTFGYVTQNPLALIDFLGLDTPSFWDQFNPWESFGKRGSIAVVDYREWYQLNFPKTLKHSIGVILDRIAQQICSSPGKKVYPGLKGGGDDVDVDMWTGQHYFEPHPFSDSRYFRLVHFYIGKHSFKTSEIDVTWSSGDRFSFKTLLYALDQKGDNDDSINPTFEYRYWVFAQWNVVGEGCCSKKTINASLTGTFSKTPKGISIP
jgi:RHS repeat-associated protein